MTTDKRQKLKKLLDVHKPGTVLLSSWLTEMGISRDLQTYYRRSGWLEAVGTGAFRRPGDEVAWQGGLYSLQVQARLPIHAGAMSALSMGGLAHYLRFRETVSLFSPPKTTLPTWFRNHDWGVSIQHSRTSFLPQDLGLMTHEEKTFTIAVATPERAILECLFLAPARLDLVECYQVMAGLVNLRPAIVQQLLEACSSIRVKRLFLYMAEKAEHPWLPLLDTARLQLGRGDRSIVIGGVYVGRHKITIPRELASL
jgi:hypothetical protein